MAYDSKPLGLAVIGSGRIGTLRARLASTHPAVRFMAVADRSEAAAAKLAKTVGAHVHGTDNNAIIEHPEVDTVIVSTSEGEHVEPMIRAIELGKRVLVEKPIALTLADADRPVKAIEKWGADVRVGYSRRYKDRYLIAKDQIVQGRLGTLVGEIGRA